MCVIPAKSISKRLPGKCMKLLDNMPLVYYSIYEALLSDMIDEVYVYTDSDEIGDFARKIGAKYLVDDYARKHPNGRGGWDIIGALIEVLELEDADILMFWQPTNPFITATDIRKMLSSYIANTCDSVIAVGTVKEHPAWLLKERHNFAEPYKHIIYRAEKNPKFIIPRGFWLASVIKLKENEGYYGKKIIPYHLPPEKALDIDDEYDFEHAQLIMYKNKIRRK